MQPNATPPYGLAVWATAAITTDPRCCDGSHPSVIPAGTRGLATAHTSAFRATNVTFRGHPHPILCLRSMVQTRRDRPPRAAVDRWVHDLYIDTDAPASTTAATPYTPTRDNLAPLAKEAPDPGWAAGRLAPSSAASGRDSQLDFAHFYKPA